VNELKSFLDSHPAADRILLDSLVVLQRIDLSPGQLLSLGDVGAYTPIVDKNVELQIGESVVAVGSIVEDSGEFYFEVSDMLENMGGAR
jgi:hypothetical protein